MIDYCDICRQLHEYCHCSERERVLQSQVLELRAKLDCAREALIEFATPGGFPKFYNAQDLDEAICKRAREALAKLDVTTQASNRNMPDTSAPKPREWLLAFDDQGTLMGSVPYQEHFGSHMDTMPNAVRVREVQSEKDDKA